jgi:hypothetical protein
MNHDLICPRMIPHYAEFLMTVRLSVAPLRLSRIAMPGSVAFLFGGLAFDSVMGLGQREMLFNFIKWVVGVYLIHMDPTSPPSIDDRHANRSTKPLLKLLLVT